LVGSEGTLGVVTRATLELKGLPEQIRGGRAIFDNLDDAADAVFDAVRSEVDVAKIELVDDIAAMMANEYLDTGLPDSPMVFVEFHANHGIEEEIEFARTIFEQHNVQKFEIEEDEERMEELWQARRELAYAVQSYDASLQPVSAGDITVPISKYPEIIRYAKKLGEENDLMIPCFGHAGDGNVHYSVLVDISDYDEVQTGLEVYDEVVKKAIEMGGTSTGEHGIGLGKRNYMVLEHGEETVEAMKRIKQALDPNNILNPNKIFVGSDEEEEELIGRFEGHEELIKMFEKRD
ncbi:MAG: FAD-linked oxidase C-terminal domain-containing protein, partial [Halobacteria archaeon]|nr:FAD-linked oxidase C-terminal domain-containing protein [Halobacteria archaeon]